MEWTVLASHVSNMEACTDHGLKGNKQGYGRFWSVEFGKKLLAHRLAFYRHNGTLPTVVMHMCDNPRCVNPAHLQAGDWATNNADRAAKGRSTPVRHDLRKLTDADAAEVRRRWALKKPSGPDKVNGVIAIARTFGVDPNTVYNIAYGRSHFHGA